MRQFAANVGIDFAKEIAMTTPPDAVPEWARDRALQMIEARHGDKRMDTTMTHVEIAMLVAKTRDDAIRECIKCIPDCINLQRETSPGEAARLAVKQYHTAILALVGKPPREGA